MQDIKAIIDIGSGRIKAIVIAEEEGKKTTLHKSLVITKGIRKGKIVDREALRGSIQEVITDINRKLGGEYVDEYVISLSHPDAIHQRITEQKRVLKEKVTNEDVRHLSTIIAEISQKDHQELIKIVPIYWVIDETERVKDPIGIEADKLDIVADIFYIPGSFYDDFVEVIETLDIYVVDIIPNILATAEATLSFDAKDLGAMSIDIGHEQTSFIVYEDGYPLIYGTIPLGGASVTRDISIGMQVDIKEAEQLKIQSGSLGLIEEQEQQETSVDQHFLNQIITARYEEILEKINKRLIEAGKDGRLAGGILFSGGGAKVRNLKYIAQDIFQLAVFNVEDVHSTSKELQQNIQFMNTLGTYTWSQKYSTTKRGIGLDFSLGTDIFKKIGEFIKKIF